LRKPSESLNVLAISVDSPEQSREFAEKIAADGKGKVDYRILSDQGHRVIDAYGIRDPDYDGQKFEGIARPTVYVINKDGRVTWMKVELNYQERPTNSDIRAALDAVGRDQISFTESH
jgi:peroxiredoxin